MATKASAIRWREQNVLPYLDGRRWNPEMETRSEFEAGLREERAMVRRELAALAALSDDASDADVRAAVGL